MIVLIGATGTVGRHVALFNGLSAGLAKSLPERSGARDGAVPIVQRKTG